MVNTINTSESGWTEFSGVTPQIRESNQIHERSVQETYVENWLSESTKFDNANHKVQGIKEIGTVRDLSLNITENSESRQLFNICNKSKKNKSNDTPNKSTNKKTQNNITPAKKSQSNNRKISKKSSNIKLRDNFKTASSPFQINNLYE